MRIVAPLLIVLAALAGCKVCTDAKPCVVAEDSPPPLALDDSEDCNANAPVITAVTVSNGGVETFDNGDYPTLAVQMDVTDDDGDLDVLGMKLWFDTTVDGAVDRSGDPPFSSEGYLFTDAEPCAKFMATLTLKPAVTSGVLDFNTRYEIATVAVDHHGVESSPFITDGVTPNSDGSDGTAP